MDYKPEALKESIEYFSKDSDNQQRANEDLAKILEIVRLNVNPFKKGITDHKALKEIISIFPE